MAQNNHLSNSTNSVRQPPTVPNTFNCVVCQGQFLSSTSLFRHMRFHSPPRFSRDEFIGFGKESSDEEQEVAAEEGPRAMAAVEQVAVDAPPQSPVVVPRGRMPRAMEAVEQDAVEKVAKKKKKVAEEKVPEKKKKKVTMGKKDVEEVSVEAPQPPAFHVAQPPPRAVVPPGQNAVEQPRARPLFDLNKLPEDN